MKILNIIDIPWFSGVASYALESSRGLSKRGHEIFFAGVRGGQPLKIAGKSGFKTVEVCSRKNPFMLKSMFGLANVIDSEQIDIVNAHTGSAHFMAYLASLAAARKFALVRTKSDIQLPKKSFLYGRTAKIVAASRLIGDRYLEIGVAPSKVVTVYQGVDVPSAAPSGLPVNPVVGLVGRLDPVKGHEYFLEAAAAVLKKCPGVKFIIAGKEENIKYSELEVSAAEKGISGAVGFCGFVDDIAAFMDGCSLGVISSTGSEAVSRVLLEWMSRVRAVVATSVGCIPEILPESFIVPPEDPAAMADKILSLLGNPAALETAGGENKKIAAERFGFEKFITETDNIFLAAIEK